MTLSVTIYFPAHCGHTGSPDWGGVSHRASCGWSHVHVDSGPVRSCGPVPFAVSGYSYHTSPIKLQRTEGKVIANGEDNVLFSVGQRIGDLKYRHYFRVNPQFFNTDFLGFFHD